MTSGSSTPTLSSAGGPDPRPSEAISPGSPSMPTVRQPHPLLLGTVAPSGLHPEGLLIALALTSLKIDEREVARDLFELESNLLASRPGQTILDHQGYASAEFEISSTATSPTSADPQRAAELRSLVAYDH